LQTDKGIIIAADVATIEECQCLAELGNQAPEIVAIKVGFSLALRYGLPLVVKSVREVSSLPVIYDHQKAATDIPAMGRSFAQICRDAGIEGVIFFPQAGPKTLEAFVSAAFDSHLTPAVGLVMTHPAYLQSEGGFIADNAPEFICQLAMNLGVRAFVLPGTKPDVVKRFAEGPLNSIKPAAIMMPGIGSQGGSLKEAFWAAKGHRPFAIIGSALYGVPDPLAALQQFLAELRNYA